MNYPVDDTLFMRAARGKKTERTPVWLMRQAGRTDPKYLKTRERAGLPLEELFRHPGYAAEISLLPRRFGVDAIIYYQDILTPLGPMGAPFVFRPSPVLEQPITDVRDLDRLGLFEMKEKVPFIGEIFDRVQNELQGELPVLGFAGAPFTLAVFLLEGGSFGERLDKTSQWMKEHPRPLHHLLDLLTQMTIEYLRYQILSGAAAVQLFESAAFLLTAEQYEAFALPYQQRIFAALRGTAPTIQFAREWNDLAPLDAAGADIISLPSSVSIAAARERLGQNRVFQGNVDNGLLVRGTRQEIVKAVRACVASGEHRGHIFNLSHGLLRETPPEHVQLVVETVRSA